MPAPSTPPRPDRRLVALFALLYLSEGAPIGFIWWALPTLLRAEGIEVDRVTSLMAALVLPWTLKFLWAPLVDALRGRRWNRIHWIVTAQTGMGLCLLPLIFLEPAGNVGAWIALLIAHACFAATQDVAIDALAVQAVPAASRGWVNGAMQAGMLLGRSVFGGVSILVVGRWGWAPVIVALVATVWSSLLALRVLGGAALDVAAPLTTDAVARVVRSLTAMVGRRTTWLAVGFALTAGAAFETAGALAGPLMLDRGMSSDAVGVFFALPSVAAMLVGGLIGGRLSDRLGRERAVGVFLCVTIVVVLALAVLPAGVSDLARFAVLSALYLGIGLFTASSYALFMDLADPVSGGTQFSAFMAATNACEAWVVWTAGRIVAQSGYGTAFSVMAAVSCAGLGLLVWLAAARRGASSALPRA